MSATRLRAAVRTGDLAQIKKLLDAGADINNDGVPPRYATKYAPLRDEDGRILGPLGIGKELQNLPWPVGAEQMRPQLTKLVLPHVDALAKDFPEWSDGAQIILSRADVVDIGKNDSYRVTPLRVAIIRDLFEAAEFLIAHGAVANNERERGPLLYELAAECSDARMIELLLKHKARVPKTGCAMSSAVRRGDLELIKFVFTKGSPINACPSPFVALLRHDAAYERDGKLLSREESNEIRLEIVKFFLSSGADVNFKARKAYQGQTPLYACVDCVHGKMRRPLIDLLLSKGAKANCRTETCMTLLHLIALSEKPELDLAELFIKKGADVNAAIVPSAYVNTAITPGTGMDDPAAAGVDLGGYTPLHLALRSLLNAPSEEMAALVKLLIANKSNVNAVTAAGRTPLHLLAEGGPATRASDALRSMVTELASALIDAGADVNAKVSTDEDRWERRPPTGPSVLHYALDHSRPELAELLVEKGATADMESASDQVKAFLAKHPKKKEKANGGDRAEVKGEKPPETSTPASEAAGKEGTPAEKSDTATTKGEPESDPAKPTTPKGVKKIVVLKDGRQIQAALVMEMGKQLAVKDVDGKVHEIAKKDVQEIPDP